MKTNLKILIAATATIGAAWIIGDDQENLFDDPAMNYQYEVFAENTGQAGYSSPAPTKVNVERQQKKSNEWEVEMKPIVNHKNGQLMAHIPLPKSWNITPQGIRGPHGIETNDYAFKMFDNMQRRPQSAAHILQQEIGPSLTKNGGKVMHSFPIPEIMQYDMAYASQLHESGQMQKSFDALGVDVVDPQGNSNFLIIRVHQYAYAYGGNWGYMIHALKADQKVYDKAKKAFIFGLSNTKSNKQHIAAHNQNEAMKEQQSWAAHNNRMRSNQAAFDARNRAFTESSNAISDMSMQTWRNNNAAQDRMQDMSVNGINGTENIYDPMSNQSYNVDSGYDRYFMNGQGEYFGTDDQFYEPGSDLNLNGTWTESYRGGN